MQVGKSLPGVVMEGFRDGLPLLFLELDKTCREGPKLFLRVPSLRNVDERDPQLARR